ncbi:hypothetical protein [Brachybacterium kimchii]|uniref:Uncharacterized protein n=1 Tax=Brachybacterium kimchii TaxID=2942909 RepID=A0ABY4N7Y9_9MICO|nr:hypothetical protein [Brachybacterium kimchii]UQN30675.1 hypothetical protein M4486_05060 [Brachybacterium kimchii]
MTSTATDFTTARFATNPDGRIAARVDDRDEYPWIVQVPGDYSVWGRDEDMVADGWSPLDETRLPRVVTDKMIERGRNAYWGDTYGGLAEDRVRAIVSAALSAAPTTDDDAGIGPETRAAYRDLHAPTTDEPTTDEPADDWQGLFNIESRRKTEAIARAEKAEQERDEVREAGRLAVQQRGAEKERADTAEQGLADLSERYREQGGALLRAESLTAREHLDAAWEAAHVPADGTIPAGAEYLYRTSDCRVGMGAEMGVPMPVRDTYGQERRLLDPPAPDWLADAAPIEALLREIEGVGFVTDPVLLSRHLAERGVRVTEEDR